MNKPSVAVRVTLWYMLLFAVAEFALGAAVWVTVRRSVYDLVDNRFESQVDGLKRFLETRPSGASLDKLKQDVTEMYGSQPGGDYLELSAETGELIYRSAYLQTHTSPLMPPDQVKRPLFRTREIDNRPFRFLFQKLNVNGTVYTVEMGLPADDAVEMLHQLRSDLFRFGALLWFLIGGAGYWITRKLMSRASSPESNSHTG